MSDNVVPFGPILDPMPGQPLPMPGASTGPSAASTASDNVTSVHSPSDGVLQSGAELWMRKWMLKIGPQDGGAPTGSAVDLSLLDFEFQVEQQINVPSWHARIKVWNVGDAVINRLINKELTNIYLEAGYQSPSRQYGQLFAGLINYFRHGRQNATDTYIEIYATTFSTAVEAATINTYLPAGWVTQDAINAVLSAMTPFGVTLGQMPDTLNASKQPRGRVLFGMARDYLRDIARTEDGHFFIDNSGRLHLLKGSDTLKYGSQTVPILNSRTGLIDVATRTMDGAIECKCLLNPAIVPGGQVHINNEDVTSYTPVNPDAMTEDARKFSDAQNSMVFKADGYYPVGMVRHEGQNRGNPWYTNIVTNKIIQPPGYRTSAA